MKKKQSRNTMQPTKKYEIKRTVCEECIGHPQDYENDFFDCKNIFYDEKGNVLGQCGCYSRKHGKRKEEVD
jgi:hypothetical protein